MRHGQTHYKFAGKSHTINVLSASSTASTDVISDDVQTARFLASVDMQVTFETEATDATEGLTLKAGVIETFVVSEGEKINARGVSEDGTLEIAEMTL